MNKKIKIFIMTMLLFSQLSYAAENVKKEVFKANYVFKCFDADVYKDYGSDCINPSFLLSAFNEINLNSSKDKIVSQLTDFGRKLEVSQFVCKLAGFDVQLSAMSKDSKVFVMTPTEGLITETSVKSSNSKSISLDITTYGFASGLPEENSLSIEKNPTTSNGYLYHSEMKDSKGKVKQMTCVKFSTN